MSDDKYNDQQSVPTEHISTTDMIKDNKIDEGDPDQAENRFNWETNTPSGGAAGMFLHINGRFTMWKLKSFL